MSDSVVLWPAPAGAGPPDERHRRGPRIGRGRRLGGRVAVPGCTGTRRRDRFRRSVAVGLIAVLMAAYWVAVPAEAREAVAALPLRGSVAAAPPPGGLVPSAANFGWTEGAFSVSHDGAAQYSVPLWTPQGRGNAAPGLGLSYNSRGGNGPVGVGWSLGGLSSITPCPRTYAQDGFTEGAYFDGSNGLCLGGNRLLPLSTEQLPQREYRTEQEMFARIVAYGMEDNVPDYFTVWAKDGQILTFGQTSDARLEAFRLVYRYGGVHRESTTTRVIAAWAVNRIEDRNGNAAAVVYDRFEGTEADLWFAEMRPASIHYAPNRLVQFSYEERTDPIDGFAGGVHTRTASRINRIAMSAGPQGRASELLRQYRLAYRNDSITGRSLLTSVTECDHDGTCKFPLQFNWSPGGYDFEEIDTDITDVDTGSDSRFQAVVLDIDGDGRDDLLYTDAQNYWKIRHSTGRGFTTAAAAGIPRVAANKQAQLRVVDFDRDGRMDVLAEVPDSSYGSGGSGWRLFRSNGLAFVPYADNIGYGGPADDELDPVYFADLDGNGMPDFVTAPYDYSSDDHLNRIDGPWRYRLNTGTEAGGRFRPMVVTNAARPSYVNGNNVTDTDGDGRAELIGKAAFPDDALAFGLNAAGGVEATSTNLHHTLTHQPGNLGDYNGDGLVDLLRTSPSLGSVAVINYGSAGAEIETGPGGSATNALRIVDFNNDGRDDALKFHGGFDPQAELQVWTDNRFVYAPLRRAIGPPTASGFASTQALDIDGDGVLDLMHIVAPLHDGRLRILKRTAGPPDELVSAGVFPNGRRVEVDYTTLGDRSAHTPGACAYPLSCPAKGGRIVRSHRVATGETGPMEWNLFNHSYKAAREDLHGRGWLGFAEHTVQDPQTGRHTVTEFDNATSVVGPTSEFAATEVYPFAQLPKRTTVTMFDRPGGRQHRRTVDTGLFLRRHSAGGYTVEPRTVTEIEQERPAATTAWQTVRDDVTETTYDAFGNTAFSASRTTSGRRVTEDFDYRNNSDTWLIGLPTRQVTTGCTAASVCLSRVSTFDHDDKGNHTKTVVEPNKPELTLTTTAEYGQFGLVGSITRTDTAGQARTETFEYGNADKLHPTATINAVGHKTFIDTHSGLGVPLSTTDPNYVVTTMRYDRFGRMRETNRSDGSYERVTHLDFGGFQLTYIDVAGGGRTTTVLDRLGRKIQGSVKGFDGRDTLTTTGYDRFGRVHTVSRPYRSGESVLHTTSEYDNRDRLTSVTTPDGATVRHEYVNRETHTVDAKGVRSSVLATVDGDVESSYQDDPASTGWLRTRFEYGPFGETTKTVAADGTAQIMVYDVLGRRKSLDDPSAGMTTSRYGAFGEVASETDAENRTTEYTHDALGRVKTVRSPDGVAANTWDTAPNGKGLVANARSADGVGINYRYDNVSRPFTTTWNIDGSQYEIRHGYDDLGRQASITYPQIPGVADRLTVNYAYNTNGYLTQVQDAAAGGTVYWAAEERDAAGHLTRERYGNGLFGRHAYDMKTGRPFYDIVAVGAGSETTKRSHIAYDFDANRNLSKRHDVVNLRLERFDYDELNRLTHRYSVNNTPAIDATFAYDKVGNLKTETFQRAAEPRQTTTYTYGQNGAPPHALTSRDNQTYGYDGAGRQTSGPQRTAQYNRVGLPTVLNWGIGQGQGQRTEFSYDASGARVVKRDAAQTTVSVPGLFERRTIHPGSDPPPDARGVRNIHHIVVDGRTVAQITKVQDTPGGPITNTETSYLHTDGQGSTVLVTDSSGGVKEGLFYDPFGRRTDAAYQPLPDNRRGGPHLGYTGHEHDDEYGLINMRGRVYDPEARRFLTPDPLMANPLSSQSHNRYAYVQNNPTTYTDPTGLFLTEGPGDHRNGGWRGYTTGQWSLSATVSSVSGSPSPLDAPLITHAPDMTNTRSVGAGTDDDNAKSSSTTAEVIDQGISWAGALADLLDLGKAGGKGLGPIIALADTVLDTLGLLGLLETDTPDGLLETFYGLFEAASTLAQGWIALNTVAGMVAGRTLTAAAAAVVAEYAGIALLATVGEIVGVVVAGFTVGLKLREWSGVTDEQLYKPIQNIRPAVAPVQTRPPPLPASALLDWSIRHSTPTSMPQLLNYIEFGSLQPPDAEARPDIGWSPSDIGWNPQFSPDEEFLRRRR